MTTEELHLVVDTIVKYRKAIHSLFVPLHLSNFPKKSKISDIQESFDTLKNKGLLTLEYPGIPKEYREDRFILDPGDVSFKPHRLKISVPYINHKGGLEKKPSVEEYDYVVKLSSTFNAWYRNFKRNKVLYRIALSHDYKVLLNDRILSSPQDGGENLAVISYLLKNPGKVTKKAIQKAHPNIPIGKDFHKTIDNLGFKNNIKKTFFPTVSSESLEFKNPITEFYFQKLNIPPLDLRKLTKIS